MATARITECYPLTYDATRAPEPYGRWAPPLFTKWLTSVKLHERQRTLFTLSEYLHDPEHITCCLDTGVVPVLCRLLDDTDAIVRHKSAQCLATLAGHAAGRDDMLRRRALTHLCWRFADSVPLVRRNVHQAVVALTRTQPGVEAALEQDLIPQLLNRLGRELNEIMLLCLTSLRPLLLEDPRRGLVLGGVRAMNRLLRSEVAAIRAAACACLCCLCRPTQGKHEATGRGSLPLLAALLQDWNARVRAQAAAAAAAIMITTQAKLAAVRLPMLERLVALADAAEDDEEKMLAVQALAVLCAHPEARRRLRAEHQQVFLRAMESAHDGVRDCAQRALEDVLWEP